MDGFCVTKQYGEISQKCFAGFSYSSDIMALVTALKSLGFISYSIANFRWLNLNFFSLQHMSDSVVSNKLL